MIDKALMPPLFFRSKHLKDVIILLIWLTGIFYVENTYSQQQKTVIFSPEEQTYIQQHREIKVCVDPDWEPYERINGNGEHEGIAADLLKLIAERVGVSLKLVETKSWEESLEASKMGKCEIVSFLNQTAERDKWLLFTNPYFTDPNVFITREEHAFISNPAEIYGETIVLPRGTSIEELVRRDYPNLKVIIVESEADAISMVNARKADMTMRSLILAAYTIKKEGHFNLKIAGQLPDYTNKFRIGVVNTEPKLRDILDKAVLTIKPQEVQQIVNRYISIKAETAFDYSLFIKIVLGFIFLAAIGFFWNYKLRKLNKKLATRESELLVIGNKLKNDIESRILAEEALRESEEKYRLLTENMADVIWVLNLNGGKFTYISPSVFQLRGFTVSEAINESIEDSLTPDSISKVKDAIAKNLNKFVVNPEESENYITELQQYCKNGQTIWIEVSTQFRYNASGEIEILGVTRNIEERKKSEAEIILKNEKLQRLNAEKDKFYSIIAHDLKSPFSSMLGFSDILHKEFDKYDTNKQKKFIGIINTSIQNTYKLLENLLLWTHSQKGNIVFNPEKTNLFLMTTETTEFLKQMAENKSVKLINQIPENIYILADKDMFSTIIRNLVSNAIKFTPKNGKITINSNLISTSNSEQFVKISIADTGVGISKEVQSKLFDLVGNKSTNGTENEKGTGLGLMLCKEFIEKHGGNIWVESEIGKGSVFYFTVSHINN